MSVTEIRPCPCGSGNDSWWELDGYGNPLCRVCSTCREKKMAQFRSDIKEHYFSPADAGESMEEDL